MWCLIIRLFVANEVVKMWKEAKVTQFGALFGLSLDGLKVNHEESLVSIYSVAPAEIRA
jgi:hypothetical protein